MTAILVLLCLISVVYSNPVMPDACFIETFSFDRDSATLTCYGGRLSQIVEYVVSQDRHITKLRLKNCFPRIPRLEKLPPMTVRELEMNNCGFKKVDDDAFANLLQLKELDLSNNLITAMPNIDYSLNGLKILKLNNNRISNISDGAFGKQQFDDSFVKLSQLEELNLSDNLITEMPNVGNLLNGLKVLNLNNNRISKISDSAFGKQQIENSSANITLRELYLSNNLIDELPDTKLLLASLNILDFSNNKISHIPEGAFNKQKTHENVTDYFHLEKVIFENNRLTKLTDFTFAGLNVRSINLADNQISYISPNAFKYFKAKYLTLQNNTITKLEPGTFDHLPNLSGLTLNDNQLSELDPSVFTPLKNLNSIRLNSNGIKQLPLNLFNGLDKLSNVYLSGNNITELDEDVFNMDLYKLFLDGNQLKRLPPKIFRNMCSLTTLNLGNNELIDLQPELFPPALRWLRTLNLQNNRLKSLPKNVFTNLKSLKYLDLRNNSLTTLCELSFEGLEVYTKIKSEVSSLDHFHIYLHGNPLVCDNKLAWVVNLFKIGFVSDAPWEGDARSGTCAAPPKYNGVELKDLSQLDKSFNK